MLLSPPLRINCVITQFSVITRLHRLARTNVVCNNSESITLLAERFPAAPSVGGGGEGRFALNDIPPALRVAIVSKTECLALYFSSFFFFFIPFNHLPPFIHRQILSFHFHPSKKKREGKFIK